MTRAMKDSGIEWIGEIPEDWNLNRTKNYFKNHKDIVGENSDEYDRLALTLNGVIRRSKEDSTGLQPEAFDGYQILRKNELVFKLIDLENISTSRVGLCPFENGIVSPAYIVLTPRNNINPKYSEYYYLSMWHREIFNHIGDNGVRSSLNAKDLLNVPITIPSMPEQQKIADFLDKKCSHIDSILEKTKASIDECKQLKQSVITQAVTKGIRPNRPMKDSRIEWIGEIPANWKVYPLKYLVDIPITDGTHNTPTYTDKENGSPFLSSKDITSGHIDWSSIKYITKELHEQLQKEVAPKRNDILLAKNGTTGIGALVEEDIVFNIYVTLALIRPNQSIVLPKFLLYLINSSLCKIQYDKHLIGIGVPNLHLNIINNVKVIITDAKDEQQEIVSYLDEKCSKIDKLITKKEQLIKELETYKKSLIYEYVTGKKEVI